MNCALALRMLDAYVDDEVDAATAAEMKGHLAACPACAGLHAQRVAMRTALRAVPLRHVAPPGLRKTILREIATSAEPENPPRSARWWQALALGVSTAVMGALGGPRTPAGPRVDVASSDRHEVRPWFQGRLEFAPMVRDLSAQGFDLLGARVDRIGDRQAVAVVYRLHSHIINVFSWRGSADVAVTAREATIRGFHVVTWSDRDMEFAAVSDTDSAELKRFTEAYRSP